VQVERPTGDRFESLDVDRGGGEHELVRNRRKLVAVGIATGGDPAADDVLVEAVRPLASREAGLVAVGPPVAAAVRGMDLVGEHDSAARISAELILGIRQDQAAFRRQRLAAIEQGQGVGTELSPLLGGQQAPGNDVGRRQRLVMPAIERLAGGRQDRLRQALIVPQPVGRRMPYIWR